VRPERPIVRMLRCCVASNCQPLGFVLCVVFLYVCLCRTQDMCEARMLTRTQIENATTEELEQMRTRIEDELEGRREAEESGHEGAALQVPKSHETPAGTFQWQMRECGYKDRCDKCKSGKRHGPYLYRFYYRDGKRHSEYIPLKKARALGLERPPVPR
jgi:hypothetical protein